MRGKQKITQRRGRAVAVLGLTLTVLVGATACGSEGESRSRGMGTASAGESSSRLASQPVEVEPAARPASARVAESVAVETLPAPEPVVVEYGDAERVFRAGDYALAADMFDAYSERRPGNPWGHYMAGIAAWRAGDHPRAEAALRRTIELDANHGRGQLNLARVLLEQRRASDALDHVERVLELDPELGEGWRVLGNAYADLGMVDDAVDTYRRALVLDHRDAWTMNNLGLLMIREGRYEDALPPLARATELRPDVAVFQNNLGIALERTGRLADAAQAYRNALYANPDHGRAQTNLDRVEARVPEGLPEPFDLTEPAREFADRIQAWRDRGTDSEDDGILETGESGHRC